MLGPLTALARAGLIALVSAAALAAVAGVAGQPPRAAAEAATTRAGDPGSLDDAAEGGGPLDLVGTRFGQAAGAELALVIRTHRAFLPADVDPAQGHLMCVWLRRDRAPAPSGRICVAPDPAAKSGVALRYTALDAAGNRIGIRNLVTLVQRGPTMISARFAPALLRLEPGIYHWQARSQHGVEDRLPDGAEIPMQIVRPAVASSPERCFGAASRDPDRRCVNPRLRRVVVPAPADAVISQNSPCTPLGVDGLLTPCEFGVPAEAARATVALIGDSHAAHWRAALEIVAQQRRWRGISITRSGCPLSRAQIVLEPEPRGAECATWNEQVPRWFERHPKIHTAFVVQHSAARVVVPEGADEFETKVAGYEAAWQELPRSVRRIVVIRDTPLVGLQMLDCVRKAQSEDRNAASLCATPRRIVLDRDPAVVAAGRTRTPRVDVVDMTRFLCDAKRCFPVVGGALVYKDGQHLTDVFATTLGPYLQRAIEAPRARAQRRPKVTDSVAPESPKSSIGAPRASPMPTSR